MKNVFVIQADYYMWSQKKGEYTRKMYLGTNPDRVYVFDHTIKDRTKKFATAKEAGEYLDRFLNNTPQRCNYETVRILEVISHDE